MPRLPHMLAIRRVALSLGAVLSIVAVPTLAHAECPPGAWFCADADGKEAPRDEKKGAKEDDTKGEKTEAKEEPKETTKRVGPGETAQVPAGGNTTIIVQTAPPPAQPAPAAQPAPVAQPAPRRAPPTYAPPPPARRPYPPATRTRHRSEWGFNMRVQSAAMDNDRNQAAEGAGMGGIGFSLRARPTGHFALDLGLDFIGGRDFNGYRRSEVPFTINGMLFINPQNRAQVYLLGGIGWSTAHVEVNDAYTRNYSYFGFQTGVGLEYRATRSLALNVDLLGFIRGRTDRDAAANPEFIDPTTGRTSNTSGGGLLRGGLTLYW